MNLIWIPVIKYAYKNGGRVNIDKKVESASDIFQLDIAENIVQNLICNRLFK